VVIVVKDGELFFAKGYGYQDAAKRVPVDPVKTLFREGSISKLFTWTAVMQLVEQGKLDLDTDVNTYLQGFKIPDTFSHPITLRNLMTHTSGLEDGYLGYLYAQSDKDYVPLTEYLSKHLPARVRSATVDFSDGTGVAYSNYGCALAGLIVATVSGVDYEEFIDQHILQPLGMNSTSFHEPLPPLLAARLSQGYQFKEGAFEAQEFERAGNVAPAGSISASGTDMAKFMIAHLRDGESDQSQILQPGTARLMHTRSLSPDPALSGMDLGFWELWVNGRRVLWHGGDTHNFHASLSLVPEAHLGLFVAFNTGGDADSAAREFDRDFLQHYFPAQLPQVKPRADAVARNRQYVGSYRDQRRSYTKIDKADQAGKDFQVDALPDGTLTFYDIVTGLQARWIEVGDGVFRDATADAFVAFKRGSDGHSGYMVGPFPVLSFDRVPWYGTVSFQKWLLLISSALFLSITISAFGRRRADCEGPRGLRWARFTVAITGLFLLISSISVAMGLTSSDTSIETAVPGAFYLALPLILLAIPLTCVDLLFCVLAWRRGAWTLAARLHYSAATLAAVGYLWLLNYWNLVGYRFG
ncbi:MAG: serine hydrolase domain-containing protein, partial [Paraburkholderia sp.]|uniref:serine hydrolase domain-containing protein n=1 Tax=Paraburkholderia sp. TaxID=1926495 RepID=UPI003C32AC7C